MKQFGLDWLNRVDSISYVKNDLFSHKYNSFGFNF